MRVNVIALCAKCGGNMREKTDAGAFSKAPLGRIWIYECDKCGRTKHVVSQTSPIEQIAKACGIGR